MDRVLKKDTTVVSVPVTVLYIKICSHSAHELFLYSGEKSKFSFKGSVACHRNFGRW